VSIHVRSISSPTEVNCVERKRTAAVLAAELNQPDFIQLIQHFLHDQLCTESASHMSYDNHPPLLPQFHGKISVYTSAISTFRAPSDLSGIGGMRHERIRATPTWKNGAARYDCVFVNTDPAANGFLGLDVARVRLFFSIEFCGITYPCALVQWMSRLSDEADENTGMWIVEPDVDASGSPLVAVIHLDSILRAAHLIGVCGDKCLPKGLAFHQSLDTFPAFYVNKFIDHHAFEIAF
jgi:hypothetical protein